MALVNMSAWLAERGFPIERGEPGAVPRPPDSPPPPDPSLQIRALESEIARQSHLIAQLQAALRTFVEREERARRAVLAGPRKGRVKRIPRKTVAPLSTPAASTPTT